MQIVDLVGSQASVVDLIKQHAVDAHSGVVTGDDDLWGDVEDLLLDIDASTHSINKRDDDAHTGLDYHAESPQAFDGPFVALGDDFDAGNNRSTGE